MALLDGERLGAEMDKVNKSLRKVSIGEQYKPLIFTFVPAVWSTKVTAEGSKAGDLPGNPNKNLSVSHEEMMSNREVFKAEKVFIRDGEEGGAGNTNQAGTKTQLSLSLDHTSRQSPSLSAQSENKPHHESAGTPFLETAVHKHGSVSQQQCHNPLGLPEVSSGHFAKRVSEDRTSPTDSTDLFPTPASSRESILSESSDRDKWSAVRLSSVTSPASLSRTVSPCSSVLSGIFTPAVVQIKKHFLAPGSSLLQTPFSSCESLSSSVCAQSPPPPPRHRPPLTRLSLLTAILRKGRLPVLSSALQRPYTPCWPVNPVTLSFCKACSAASSVASIPLEFSSRFSSSASIDSQSHLHREPNRGVTSPPPVQPNELGRTSNFQAQAQKIQSKSRPAWEQDTPPAAERSGAPTRAPLPVFYSNLKSISAPKRGEMDSSAPKKPQHTHISISQELKSSNNHMYPHGHEDTNLKKLISPSPKLINEQGTSVPRKWTPPPNPSLSKLRSLSQQLRSPPASLSPPSLQPSHSHSPLPPSQYTAGRCEPGGICPDSKSAKINTSHFLLSPSRYTPIIFPEWSSPADSPTPTPSPAPPVISLTSSPSLSLRSTPSPRPGSGISDCSDREGKKRKMHKIKQSYKSLAAIPTNTLLLDQQVIDEQVERGESPWDTPYGGVADTHAEMCSPSQLRQQSAELYATIDEILANSAPPSKTSSATTNAGPQKNSSFLKSLGRETKYASLSSLHPSTGVERKFMETKKTKPGVIRPMTAIPRLRVEDEEEFHPNPFKKYDFKQTSNVNRKVCGWQKFMLEALESMCPTNSKLHVENKSSSQPRKDFYTIERIPERRTAFSMSDLQITEPEDQISHQVKDAATSFRTSEGRMNAFETHI
ncbi:Hypothetical predicted protein [Xyrichtys novacula]|uniref:Muscular LMNA-interacting protein n=1 Tax=Xyrichtys novacula TaxID=13765 RepID=A0AAV1G224_XYRNO|nr:Hypothetical predicted protein [Xyrichtys novacula]